MRVFALILGFVGVCLLAAAPQAAQAQATRTWVSGVGDDVNPCSRTAPCKTFAGAISKTAAGGEIDVLDSGGFGTLTITKAITIDGNTGAIGSSLASGTVGFTVSAAATDRIILRNLTINGAGVTLGTNGVNVVSAGSVTLANVNIMNFSNFCINFQPANKSNLIVDHSNLDNCAGGAVMVSTAAGTGGINRVTISSSTLQKSGFGVSVGANSSVIIADSLIANGANGGVLATTGTSKVLIRSSDLAQNQVFGVHSSGGGAISLTDTNVSFTNGTGMMFEADGSVIGTWTNNYFNGNIADGTSNVTFTLK